MYSLSSVASVTDIITYVTSSAAIALLVGWAAAAIFRKIFRHSPGENAEWTLDLVLLVNYLIALPLLFAFALNGILVTWTLPHLPSMFAGFLALLQMLSVTIVGAVLAAACYLITLLIIQKKNPIEQSDLN